MDARVAIAVRDDEDWTRLAARLGPLARHLRFLSLAGRRAAEDELEAMLADWTASRNAQQVEDEVQSVGAPAHVVADSKAIAADPQLQHLGHLVRLPHELGGESVVEASRFRLHETPAAPRRAAPSVGRDNVHVLRDLLGHDEARIARR